MQGAGNDFIIIDNRAGALNTDKIVALAPELCHRRYGIGADGVIALQESEKKELDYTMFYRNADGSDAGMCGNGARCLALYASKRGLGEELRFNVHETIYKAKVKPSKNTVTIFFLMEVAVKEISIKSGTSFLQAYTGTEHIVRQVSKNKLEDGDFLISQGRKYRNHPQFNPPGTNVNFICGNSDDSLDLRTYERGVEGLTLACGTGAIASALTWHHILEMGACTDQVMKVHTKGGNLWVHYTFDTISNSYKNIRLTGEAHFVFEGSYTL